MALAELERRLMSMPPERGSSQLAVFVRAITEDEVDALMNHIADWLVEHKLTSDPTVQSVICAGGFEWPDDADEFTAYLAREGYTSIMLPSPHPEGANDG